MNQNDILELAKGHTDIWKAGYQEGLKEGVRRFAWWKDGSQYVGTCGTTLKKAIEEINKAQEEPKP